MTYHSVITSSLRIKHLETDKFDDFSSDIDYNSKRHIFRDAISLIINHCELRHPKGASGGNKVSASPAGQASEACLYIYIRVLQEIPKFESYDVHSSNSLP